jgi:hypothetical protein
MAAMAMLMVPVGGGQGRRQFVEQLVQAVLVVIAAKPTQVAAAKSDPLPFGRYRWQNHHLATATSQRLRPRWNNSKMDIVYWQPSSKK